MQNCTAVDDVLVQRLGLEQPAFVAQLLPQLMELVRASRRLPVGEEHAIRRGSKEFLMASKELGQRSMSAVNRTIRWLDSDVTVAPEELVSFNLVEDSIDTVLERVDGCLRDALAGLSRSSEASPEEVIVIGGESSGSASTPKPQVRWRELVDNDRSEFVPRLLVKHNQKVPLSAGFLEAQRRAGLRANTPGQQADGNASKAPGTGAGAEAKEPSALLTHLNALGVDRDKASTPLSNPYEEELRSLAYADGLFETRKPEQFKRMEDTPLVWVRTARELRQLINEVKATCVGKEIAVDVEHHDQRSYRGFTCLVQLSTRQKDFLIDPFDIFEQMHWLNEIFTDPSILKVLHGADRDVQWLQRDFSVYLVNMFDTGQATRALRLQGGFSLANLVSHYCGMKLDKKYQTADWRMRPIPTEMAHYARCDTHYLLYCFDILRNSLLSNGPYKAGEVPVATADGVVAMRGVLDKTAKLCATQYTESPFDAANVAMRLCERFGSKSKSLESRQFGCLKALASWRDTISRRLDESSNFIAPDACLWRVALALPTTAARLRSTCNPLPQTLAQHANEVVDVVVKSAEATANADTPLSPLLMPLKSLQEPVSVPDSDAAASDAAPAMLPAATLVATPQHQAWPPTSCRQASPIVRVSSGSLRHATTNGDALHRSSSLTSMFESESSAEEDPDVDLDALRDLAPAFARITSTTPTPWPLAAPLRPAAPTTMAVGAPVEETAPMKEEDAGAGAVPGQPQSLRDAYQLPSAPRRKKKKKRPVEGAAAAAAPLAAPAASASGGTLEAEAHAFRAALATAFTPAEETRPAKRPRTDEPGVAAAAKPSASPGFGDLYAASQAASDPYAALADPYSAAAAPAPGPRLGPNGRPLKKKKKQIVATAGAPVADPYL